MNALLGTVLRWIGKHFFAFLLLIAALAIANWLREDIAVWKTTRAEAQGIRNAGQRLADLSVSLESAASTRLRAMEKATREALEARLVEIDAGLKSHNYTSMGFPLGETLSALAAGDIERLVRGRLEHAVLEWERDAIAQLLAFRERRDTRQEALQELQRLQQRLAAEQERLAGTLAERTRLVDAHPLRAYSLGFPEYAEHVRLRRQEKAGREGLRRTEALVRGQRERVNRLPPTDAPLPLPSLASRLGRILAPLEQAIAQREDRWARHWINRFDQPVREVLPTAAGIAAVALLLPALMKTMSFFILAPLASRQPPVRILPDAGVLSSRDGLFRPDMRPEASGSERLSAVSLPVQIGPEDDLLVHPDSLQSTGVPGAKQTKWVLDRAIPMSSLAAGLVALTRIRLEEPGVVVVSARHDPMSEIAALRIAAGAAMVVHPRCLVGVVHRRGLPVRISRHWRLGSLHAWLTLQLRYLVFHGEATLLVQGCRGVRREYAGSGRTIRQSMTLAFDAHARYGTRRCDTFWAYFSGQRELLNDCFAGEAASFVFQEAVPCAGRGPAGRRVFGRFGDVVLRTLGL